MGPSPVLSDCLVLDLSTGLVGALMGRVLKDLGAEVERIAPQADPFYETYPAYQVMQRGSNTRKAASVDAALRLLERDLGRADLLLIGGEDVPGLSWRPDARELSARYPRLVILDVGGGPEGTRDEALPAVEILAQAVSGLVFEQHGDRPAVCAFPAASYGAMCQGLIGAFGALCERVSSNQGQIVRTSLVQGVFAWLGHDWYRFDRDVAVAKDVTPKGARPLIFRCEDNKYIHVVMATPDARRNLYTVLAVQNPVPTLDEDPRGLPSIRRGARHYFGDWDSMCSYFLKWKRDELLEALKRAGVAAEAVNRPGEPWSDDQVAANGALVRDADGYQSVALPIKFEFSPGEAGPLPQNVPGCPPLTGVRVVDFGSFTAGPHASVGLQDLGAEVIKVEPLGGDVMRNYFLKFTASSRGKRVLAVDMKQAPGRDIVSRLCSRADVVHHNFRPGVTARLGIDAASLHRRRPDVIVAEAAAYGFEGPRAQHSGFDMTLQAYCGLEFDGSGQGNEPDLYRLPIVDFAAGQMSTLAILVALWRRSKTGEGAIIQTSLLDCGLHLLVDLVKGPDNRFLPRRGLSADQLGWSPAERLYKVGEVWLAVALRDDGMAERFIRLLRLDGRIMVPRANWGSGEALLIEEALCQENLEMLLPRLEAASIWAVRCRPDARVSIFADALLARRGTTVSAVDRDFGPFTQLGVQFELSRSPVNVAGDSPRLGEHTEQILEELCYSRAEIEQLISQRVVTLTVTSGDPILTKR